MSFIMVFSCARWFASAMRCLQTLSYGLVGTARAVSLRTDREFGASRKVEDGEQKL